MWRLKRHRERFFTSGNPNKHGRGTSLHFYFFLRVWDSLGTFQPRFIAGSGRVCGIEPCKSQPFCSLAMFFLQPMFPFLPSFKKSGQAALSPELLDGYIYIYNYVLRIHDYACACCFGIMFIPSLRSSLLSAQSVPPGDQLARNAGGIAWSRRLTLDHSCYFSH